MRDLILKTHDLKSISDNISNHAAKIQRDHHFLINELVKFHQQERLAKNYSISDAIREILNNSGVIIIQGTAGYKYEDIPKTLKGRQVDDVWQYVE